MSSDTPPQQRDFDNGESPRKKRGVPEGLWIQCDSCKSTVYRKQVEQNLYLCPDCSHHFVVPGRVRIQQLLDEDSFEEWFGNLSPKDPLGFVDSKPYKVRLLAEQKKTGLKDACIAGRGYMRGRPLVFALTDSSFIMGSMGSVVGEMLTRSVEEATRLKLPLVILSGSGGGGSDARGDPLADANGESQRRFGAISVSGRIVYFGTDKPHNGGCRRELCLIGGYHSGRTESPRWICRTSSCAGNVQD